jgi:uncharacterized protein Yka (UPF0111/DUF47 family)
MEAQQLKRTDNTMELTLAVNALVDKKSNVLRDHLVESNSNEAFSDNNVRKAIHQLFSTYTGSIEIIKLKDLYKMSEAIFDAAGNSGHYHNEELVRGA